MGVLGLSIWRFRGLEHRVYRGLVFRFFLLLYSLSRRNLWGLGLGFSGSGLPRTVGFYGFRAQAFGVSRCLGVLAFAQ